uniref:Uncharacterized protein n=1 Tax=Ditylum brightwellii TaxID=49249 RepID=A0A7S4S1V7_9STRA
MAERSLFELLNVEKEKLDTVAVIRAAQRNPQDIDLFYNFGDKFKEIDRRCPLHQAILLGLGVDVIDALSSPVAVEQTCGQDETPLHLACSHLEYCLDESSLDVVTLLLKKYPEAAGEVNDYDQTPLHHACESNASLDVISALLDSFPDAVHYLDYCYGGEGGCTPLHRACEGGSSLEVVSALLDVWPDAAKKECGRGWTPVKYAVEFDASLDMVKKLLDIWLEEEDNRTTKSVEYLQPDDNPCELLNHLYSLFENFEEGQSNLSPDEIMAYFIHINWWNGTWLVINNYPSVIKKLHLHTSAMADFLSVAGKRCRLLTMLGLIVNEPDLLAGV